MTATEMEDAIKNIDARTTRIEQILPTLATKDDLRAAFAGLGDRIDASRQHAAMLFGEGKHHAETLFEDGKRHAEVLFEDSKRHADALAADARRQALVLYEDLKDTLRIIAEHTARRDGE